MKGRRIISLLCVLLAVACRRDAPSRDSAELGITLVLPAASVVKADVSETPASAAENAVMELKIWVFRSDASHQKVAYLALNAGNPADDFPQGGNAKRYALPVSRNFALERPDVDVFVLANASSIQSDLEEESSWSAVRNAAFGGYFGPADAVSAVPDTGLPMSAVGLNCPISGEDPSLSVPTISLRRMVSKIHYYFCQTLTEGNPDEVETITIDKITLDGGQICANEYLFSADGGAAVAEGGYVDSAIETTGPGAVRKSEAPELYAYAGQDGVSYEQLLAEGLQEQQITDAGTLYLRESDKALSGTVYYSVSQGGVTEHREKPFSMSAPGDFARNHSWILYGYFITNRTLQLSLSVLPWDMNKYKINFSSDALMVTQKLTVVPESVSSIEPLKDPSTGAVVKDHFNVYMFNGQNARAYLYVATPENGWLQINKQGDERYFEVTPDEVRIDPNTKKGRVDISIGAAAGVSNTRGKSITLTFKAFTPDQQREIAGASECVDQVYHFILP